MRININIKHKTIELDGDFTEESLDGIITVIGERFFDFNCHIMPSKDKPSFPPGTVFKMN